MESDRSLTVLPTSLALEDGAFAVTHLDFFTLKSSHHKASVCASCYTTGPSAPILAAQFVRPHQIAGLKAEPLLPAGTTPDGKPILVRSAYLTIPPPFCGPDLHICREPQELLGGAGPHTQCVVIMLFGQPVLNPLILRPTTGSPFDRQAGRLELGIQVPTCGIHRRGILERGLPLGLNARQTGGFPLHPRFAFFGIFAGISLSVRRESALPAPIVRQEIG